MPIPNIIHQIWVGPNPIPKKSIEFIAGIKALHPDFEYRAWSDSDITPENFVNYDIIQKTTSYAQKADIMRYEILYKHGGIYLDIDFEVFKHLGELLTHDLIICNEDKNTDKYMTNAFIASSKHNPELLKCIENIKGVNFKLPINQATGPYYFRKCIHISESVRILPTEYVYPLHYTQRGHTFTKTANTYAVHHWDKNW